MKRRDFFGLLGRAVAAVAIGTQAVQAEGRNWLKMEAPALSGEQEWLRRVKLEAAQKLANPPVVADPFIEQYQGNLKAAFDQGTSVWRLTADPADIP